MGLRFHVFYVRMDRCKYLKGKDTCAMAKNMIDLNNKANCIYTRRRR